LVVEAEDLHQLLTHVVDETATICAELHQELFQQPGLVRSAQAAESFRAEA
jgi:hypothetical protein